MGGLPEDLYNPGRGLRGMARNGVPAASGNGCSTDAGVRHRIPCHPTTTDYVNPAVLACQQFLQHPVGAERGKYHWIILGKA
jgi:hypothetical protein